MLSADISKKHHYVLQVRLLDDASLRSIAPHLARVQHLHMGYCPNISDEVQVLTNFFIEKKQSTNMAFHASETLRLK